MKLIKMQPSTVTIKSDDAEFVGISINDLVSVSDGKVKLITIVSSLTNNDVEEDIGEEDFLSDIEMKSMKTIECSILGSIKNGKFTDAVDEYPTPNPKAEIVSDKEFQKMLSGKVKGFEIGKYAGYDCKAVIDGNKFFQRHSCIVGNTGSGKSETVTKIVEETVKNTNCNIIIFDIHGEYRNLSYVDNIAFGEELPFPIWLFGFSDIVANILKIKEESATVYMSALRRAFHVCVGDKSEDKPVWFDFERFVNCIRTLNEEMVDTGDVYKSGDRKGMPKTTKGEYNGKLSSILSTLENLQKDKRYSFLFEDKGQEYLGCVVESIMGNSKKVKNIDLSNIPHDVALIIIGAVTRLVYNVQLLQENPRPLTIVCDEAHVYIPTNFQLSASQRRMVEIFENIAKEGRKFGITLFVASQRPSELNKTIVAQCANYICMKLNNETDKSMMKSVMAEGSSAVIESTSSFAPGDAIVIGDCLQVPLKIHVDLAEERPQAKTIEYWDEWQKESEGVDFGVIEEYLRR